jgi:hypothetical protein
MSGTHTSNLKLCCQQARNDLTSSDENSSRFAGENICGDERNWAGGTRSIGERDFLRRTTKAVSAFDTTSKLPGPDEFGFALDKRPACIDLFTNC